MGRNENGRAATLKHGTVVLADVIAKLSGVGVGSVVRVLAAAQAVALFEEMIAVEVTEMLDHRNTPYAAADEERAQATEAYCRKLAAWAGDGDDPWDETTRSLLSILKLHRCR